MNHLSKLTRLLLTCLTLFLLSETSFSQCYGLPPKNIFTDPDNYVNEEDPTSSLRWDWRQQFWFGYRPGTPTPVNYQINSPFYNTSNPNLFDLSSQTVKNYSPQNGWEYLIKNFGTATQPIDNPYFILYNKYTGLIRIFVQINSNYQNAKSAMLTLRFKEGMKTAGTLSQLGDKSFGLNNFKKSAKALVPNQYINGGQGSNTFFWLYADFNTLYDPCACKQTSMLYLESFLFSSWQVSLETLGTAKTIISNDPNAINQVKNEDTGFGFGSLQDVTSTLSKGLRQMTDAATKLFTYADKFADFAAKLPKKKVQDKNKESIIKQVTPVTEQFNKIADLLGFPAFLSGIVNSILGVKTPATFQFAHTDINLQTSGTLQQEAQFSAHPFRNPGSDKGTTTAELNPVYNNRLGVFNILELPKIEYAVYEPLSKSKSLGAKTVFDPTFPWHIQSGAMLTSSTVSDCLNLQCEQGYTCGGTKTNPVICYKPKYRPSTAVPIYHYKVTSPLKFVVNPAANVKLVSIQTSLVFQVGKTSYPTGEGQLSPTKGKILGTQSSTVPEAWTELNAVGFSPDLAKVKAESEFRLNRLGFDLISRHHENDLDSAYLATQMIPATCIQNTSFLMANGFLGGEKKISLRVSLIFEPKVVVPGSPVEKILQTYTFDYDDASVTKIATPPTVPYYIDRISYSYFMNNGFYDNANGSNAVRLNTTDITYHFPKGFMYVPSELNYSGNGQCIPIGDKNLTSLGDIIIDGQLCYTTTPVTFYVGGEVKLLNGSTLPPNVTVVKTVNDPCSTVLPVESDPTALCNSTEYNTLSQANRVGSTSPNTDTLTGNGIITDVAVSPNPASDNFNVRMKVLQKTKIRIDVFNTLSQKQPKTSITGDVLFDRGVYNFKVDASMLSNGVYFVRIVAGNQLMTKKIIIQKK